METTGCLNSYHMTNSDYYLVAKLRPSQARTGMIFTTIKAVKTFERGGVCGRQNIIMPAGKYVIVSRKYFRAGTIEVAPVRVRH